MTSVDSVEKIGTHDVNCISTKMASMGMAYSICFPDISTSMPTKFHASFNGSLPGL